MLIRQATADDAPMIHVLHNAAFAPHNPGVTGEMPEARLVEGLRGDGDLIPALSLVAVRDGEVIGHACASPARLGDDPASAVGFGPLGVLPAHQRSGAGSALVHATVGAANALGRSLVVLLGSPAYYARFGFVLAETLGITPPVADWAPHFQALPLAAYTPGDRGAFRYAPAFDRL
ncbi:GNAT family N-acetyltransferase [Amycolatopsis jiangsuensis]|uniref:Putative acetyltransferase n=1 Tax=Amycolatopsis jiangsuensis TaxID=1181879 RepID=A0A840J0U3_9PSEU|nr:N-acetyltransferase [Amycolatopsis jiangsuensis]MBB4688596.1 putative acetyltransferase [Amycolatopsis jiangsuensis]